MIIWILKITDSSVDKILPSFFSLYDATFLDILLC